MKASPVLLLSVGMLASAAPPTSVKATRDVTPAYHASLSMRNAQGGSHLARDTKAIRFRRHRQAMKRLQRRRAADLDTTDDDTDTDDDNGPPSPPEPDTDTDTYTDTDDGHHVGPPSPAAPVQPTSLTTSTASTPKPRVWDNDCNSTDTEWEEERRRHCPTQRPTPIQTTTADHKPTAKSWDDDCDTTDTEWEEERRVHCPTLRPSTTIQTTTMRHKSVSTTWGNDCETTDTEWEHERRAHCPSSHRQVLTSTLATAPAAHTLATFPSSPASTPERVEHHNVVDSPSHDTDTDCDTSDDEFRRNCRAASRTTTTLAHVTWGTAVTVTPPLGDNLAANEETQQSGGQRRQGTVGSAVFFAGLFAAAVVI